MWSGSVSPCFCKVTFLSCEQTEFAAVLGFVVRMLWEEAQTVAGDTSDLLFPFNYKAEL